jgi:ethanolamine-phosphate cytidylyltransferase
MLLMTREHHLPDAAAVAAATAVASGGDARRLSTGRRGANLAGVTSGELRSSSSPVKGGAVGAVDETVDAGDSGSEDEDDDSGSTEGDAASAEEHGHTQAAAILSRLNASSAGSKFLPTARRIMQFSEGKVPKPDDRVVYMCGAFDLFNAGHIEALKKAREFGDFLLVGVHDDPTVNKMRGHGLPILNLYERTLSLLSCKYVDEVIIGAPFVMSEEMIRTMNISVVVRGTAADVLNKGAHEDLHLEFSDAKARDLFEAAYAVPKAKGMLREFASPSSLTALDIVHRIMAQREQFQKRYETKSKSEANYVANKTYVQEN